MVRLTAELISRGTSGYNKKKREESSESYLKRLTHLYLENKSIDEVGEDIALCKNLTVLYLYDNALPSVPALSDNQNLTHLYLQNNQIKRIENLHHLPRLSKLYMGGNELSVIEGLDSMEALTELHVENQRLPVGEKLLFDPRTLKKLTPTIQVLNVSGNQLDSLSDFQPMRRLTQFMAGDNRLVSMREVAACLSSWPEIWRLELADNPLTKKTKFRDRIIVMSRSLEVLDGKEINETSRQFLMNWKASKEASKKKQQRQDFPGKLDGVPQHPPNGSLPPLPMSDQSQGFAMPGLHRKQFQEVLAKSSADQQVGEAYHHSGSTTIPLQHERFLRSASYDRRTAPSSAASMRQTKVNFVTF